MRSRLARAALAAVLASCLTARAEDAPPRDPDAAAAEAPEAGVDVGGRQLQPLTGRVDVRREGKRFATMHLPADWTYLADDDARFVVEELWRNPPDPSVLGLVLPPLPEGADDWGIVVSYEDSGHVNDDDAKDIDYDALLDEMRDDVAEVNPERRKAGYPTITLNGWAEPPYYDADTRKLYWAKALQFEGGAKATLNYDVRVLGRSGVLVLSAVASLDALGDVAAGSKTLLAATEFVEGERYADFQPGVDRVAAYGIGGLIAGKVLAKAGFFKVLAGFAKPLIVVGAAALAAIARFLGRKKDGGDDTQPPS